MLLVFPVQTLLAQISSAIVHYLTKHVSDDQPQINAFNSFYCKEHKQLPVDDAAIANVNL